MRKCAKRICLCAALVLLVRCTMLLQGGKNLDTEWLHASVKQEVRSVEASLREFASSRIPYDGFEILKKVSDENYRIRFFALDKLTELKNILSEER